MNKLSSVKEFIRFLAQRKKYWIIPIVIILLLFGALLILAQGSVVAPFVYPLF